MTLPANTDNDAVKAITKNTIREEVYAEFDSQGLQKALHPVRHHIPRFPTVKDAVAKLAELPEYQNATTVVTKTGSLLEEVRVRVLKDEKKLLIPIPFPADTGTLFVVKPPENADEKFLQKCVTRMGLRDYSEVVPVDTNCKAEIIILGSVAVDKQGRRIGSGKDYCDLESAVMVHKGMITKDTIIATIVHDIQVKDSLAEDLFMEHDVHVGLIVTPTQVIRVDPPPAPPPGILWKFVTKSMLKIVPILGDIHEVESSADPSACELKEETVEREVRPRRRIFRAQRSRQQRAGDGGGEDEPSRPATRKARQRKPRKEAQRDGEPKANGAQEGEGQGEGEGEGNTDDAAAPTASRPRRRRNQDPLMKIERQARRRFDRRRYQIDFSLCVRNLAPDVRVRDLKNALADCHVKPAEIKWRGHEGYAVLHFAREGQESSDSPTSMDGMIGSLRNLKVSSTKEDGLVIEPYNRVTRIEVTDQVTAV